VTEANNAAYDEFDEERFIAVLKAHRTLPASEIVQAVIKAVTEFAAGAPQADDYHPAWWRSGYSAHRPGSNQTAGERNAPKTNVSAST